MAKSNPRIIVSIDTNMQEDAAAQRRALMLETFNWQHCCQNNSTCKENVQGSIIDNIIVKRIR